MSARSMRRMTALGLFSLVVSCGGDEAEPDPPLRPVIQQVVGQAGGQRSRTFSGSAATGRVVNLSFRSSGVVVELNVVLGQRVEQGVLLARLDNVAARLAHEQALLSLNSAASQMNTAQLARDRTRSLYEGGTASLSDYENARNAYRTAEAGHQSAQRSVQIQEEQIAYGLIYAPASGTIAAVNVEIDENVQPGQPVGVLNVGGDLEIALGIPESVIAQVTQRMTAAITFSAVPGRTFQGSVTEVSPSVDPNTATYPVRVTLESPTADVRPGMAASVTLDFTGEVSGDQALIVPAKAVGEDDQGRFVFVVEPTGEGVAEVRKQLVTIGRLTAEGFEILEGLTPGQRVATAGLQTLLDGQRVRLR